jgi:hypothetical protein
LRAYEPTIPPDNPHKPRAQSIRDDSRREKTEGAGPPPSPFSLNYLFITYNSP